MLKLLTAAALLVLVTGFAARGPQAAKTYRFKCPRTQQVFEYNTGAAPPCPTHGTFHLIRVND